MNNKNFYYISGDVVLGKFLEECRKLPHRSSKKIMMGENTVRVYRENEIDGLFAVYLSQNGILEQENDYDEIPAEELDGLVGRLLFQGYQAEPRKIEVDTVFGKLFAEINGDPDYPGIVICMEIEDKEQNTTFDRQFALMECTPDIPRTGGHALRLMVWNSDLDDYTNDFTFLEEDIPDETPKEVVWEKYLDYLRTWTLSHNGPGFYGMTPACFDEWYVNEYKKS